MSWCAWCGGVGRRRFLALVGQAILAAGLAPRRGEALGIYDEAGDVKIGQEADPEILKRFGYYDGPELQAYVAGVGGQLLRSADTRFNFQFKVVDHPGINAMALPGGFVYITRGILAEMNDEAQLAGILGHEVTHVNARHSAKLLTRAFGAQLATILGIGAAAASGAPGAATGVAMISQHVSTYMLLGYGREFELEADEVGLRYAHRAGYDPRRMVAFLRTLRRKEILRGQSMYHALDATHPDTAQRMAKADTMASLLAADGGPMQVKADAYKAALEGLRYGEAGDRRRLRIYTVQAGDTLAGIARDQMGREDQRYELASLNGLADDAALEPGTRLKLVVKY